MKKSQRCSLALLIFIFIAGFAHAQGDSYRLISERADPAFPDCEDPINVRVGEIGSSSVKVKWDEPKDSYGKYHYQLRYREAGASVWTTQEVKRRMGVLVENLLPDRGYELELRRVCSKELELFSDWSRVGVAWTAPPGANRSLPNEVCGSLTKGEFAEVSSERVVLSWDGPPAAEGGYWYQARYRYTQERAFSPWVEAVVRSGNFFVASGLQKGVTYEFEVRLLYGEQVRGGMAAITCDWLPVGEITINSGDVENEEPDPEITLPPFNCGDNFTGVYADPTTALASAEPGDVFNINGFPILLTQVSGGAGVFSGEGIVPLPFNQRTVKVTFSGIQVNANNQVFGGTVTAVSDDPGNYPDLSIDTISIGGGICIPPQQAEGFDQNGIHSATGQPWDENGFGPNGQYVQQPPYPGWSPGDPYDPDFDPNGFDANGIHVSTGTEYNENGCNQQGFDSNGQPCDPSGPGPYYWMDPEGDPPTQAGIVLADQVEDTLRIMLEDAWNLYLGRANDSIAVNRVECDAIRADMNSLMTTLGYDRNFIFGQNEQYFEEGMSELFTAEPKPLLLNIVRSPQQKELEEKHIELWHCDTALMKFLCSRDFIIAQLQNAALDDKVGDLLDQIRHFSEEDALTYSDPNNLMGWIQGIVTNDIKQACNIGSSGNNGIGQLSTPEDPAGQGREAWAATWPDLSPDKGAGLLLADIGEEGQALLQSFELAEEDISFLFRQGFQHINGVDRAYYLEALAKQQALLPPAGGNLLPVVVEKEILGKIYKVYLDNIVFTTSGATLDAYFVLEIPTSGDRLVFKALNIPFGPTGMMVNTRLELGTDVAIRINNAAKLTIKGTGDTYVEWDCEGFAGMGVDAEIEFCREYIKPLDPSTLDVLPEPQRARAFFTVAMPAWGEFIAQLDFDPFAITGLEDIKWQVHNARLDFSESETPPDIAFPVNYGSPFVSAAGQASPLWKGFYLEELTVTLPDNLAAQEVGQQGGGSGSPVSISVQDVIIDDRGVTGKALVANIMPLSEGRNLGGWAFSIDTFSISVVANALEGVGFNGLIHVPIFRSGPSNSAPITEADCLKYQAIVQPGNIYNFAIHPASDTTFHVPLWVGQANIRKNSSVSITYSGGEFLASATLYGDIEIDGLGNNVNVEVPKITFEGVTLSNKAPYFSPGIWGFPNSIGAKIGGFGISLENLALAHTDNPEEVALDFGILINLINEDINVTAGGGFRLVGELNESSGRQLWDFKQFKVTDILIDASWAGVNKVTGQLSFYENNSQFGNGFRGMVSVRFAGLGADGDGGLGIDAVAQFGSKDDFKYFFIDAMVHLTPGIPIGPAINIRGFGGGAYYRMRREASGSYVSLPANATGTPSLPALGVSLSGITYVPDGGAGLGLKATIALATSKEQVFNANATFEISFNGNGGLSEIRFYGNARFMESLDMGALPAFASSGKPNNGAAVSAYVDILYNFQAKTLDANLEVYLNVAGGLVVGAGSNGRFGGAELHFSPDTWYINIGTPSQRNGMKINIPVIGNIFTFESYLDVGNMVPPMPPLPANVASVTGAGNFMANENLRASGSGFAFGARAIISTGDLEFLVFYASFMSDIGFDVMLQDYGDAVCAQSGQQIGINGWYASGQAWAYMEGDIGIKVRIFGSDKRFKILSIAAGAVLQMKLPNPFWAQGSVGGRYSILGGLIKGDCNFQVTLGESCQITGANDPSESLQVILNVAPGDGAEGVAVNTRPNASFNLPLGEQFPLADVNGNVSNYQAVLEYARLTVLSNNLEIPGEVEMSFGNFNLDFAPFNMLPPNEELKFEVKVRILKDGQQIDTETKAVTFTTGPALAVIPEGNVLASYPLNGQYNYYKNEKGDNTGYILLRSGQPELFNNIPEGYYQRVRITRKNGSTYSFPIEYDAYAKKVIFPLPGFLLQNESMYKVEIINIAVNSNSSSGDTPLATAQSAASMNVDGAFSPTVPVNPSPPAAQSQTANTFSDGLDEPPAGGNTPPNQVLYTIYFRTSAYNTFMEKLNAIEQNHSTVYSQFQLRASSSIEPFDKFEMGLDDSQEGLVEAEARLEQTAWYQNTLQPQIYSRFPGWVDIGFPHLMEITRRPVELGLPPNKTVGITQSNNNNMVEVTPLYYSVGFVPNLGNLGQYIEYGPPQFVREDLIDFVGQLQANIDDSFFFPNIPEGDLVIDPNSIPQWVNQVINMPVPVPPSGNYPVVFKYKLPGLNTVTTIHTIDLIRN